MTTRPSAPARATAALLALLVGVPASGAQTPPSGPGTTAPATPHMPRPGEAPRSVAPRPDAPKPPSRAETLERLYEALAKAPDPAAAEPVVKEIEQIWGRSDSPTANLLLSRALIAAEAKDFDLALQFLDHVTDLYPDWPEGFNRRAYLYVIKLEYTRALGDLRRVLALDPGNFRALEGLVQVLRTMGQDKAALDVVRTLVKAHPNSPGAKETLKELQEAVNGRGI